MLEKVKIKDAETATIDLGNDETNHITADLIREKNPKIKILSVGEEMSYAPVMQKRINHVVNPHFMCAMRLTSLAKRPSVVTHLDRMLYKKDGVYRVEEVKISSNSCLIGKTLGEIDFPKTLKLIVTEIMRATDGGYDSNFLPLPEDVITDKMILIVQGKVEDVEILRNLADGYIKLEDLKKQV
jgi:voltage-gated potassium channel